MTRPARIIFTILFAAVTIVSCVKENSIDDCPSDTDPGTGSIPVTLFVDFDAKLYTRADPAAEVEQFWVYVFGHDRYFLGTIHDPDPAIGPGYSHSLDLEPDGYYFVGWSNLNGSYLLPDTDLVVGQTTVDELFVELDLLLGDTISYIPDHLHYGIVREPARADQGGWEYEMFLKKLTYTINIVTEGLDPDDHDYRYVIADHHSRFGFMDHRFTDRTVYYAAPCEKDEAGQLYSSLRMLNLTEQNEYPTVRIENLSTGENLFEEKLVPRLQSLHDAGETVDFDTRHEYTLKLVYEAGVLVTIYIDGWVVYRYDEYDI